jgi:hypothetical protein
LFSSQLLPQERFLAQLADSLLYWHKQG